MEVGQMFRHKIHPESFGYIVHFGTTQVRVSLYIHFRGRWVSEVYPVSQFLDAVDLIPNSVGKYIPLEKEDEDKHLVRSSTE